MKYRFFRKRRGLLAGIVAALLNLVLLKIGLWQNFEHLAYGQLFKLRGEYKWAQQTVIIGIDDYSLTKLGKFPWPRRYYAQLLEQLTTNEASVVVFDLVFADSSVDDQAFATAIQSHGQVVLAQGWNPQKAPIAPTPLLATAALTTGHINKTTDFDGLPRRVRSQIQGTPTLGLAAAQVYALVRAPLLPIADVTNLIWLNWPGAAEQAHHYSFIDVLEGKIPPQQLRHKIVFIGVTAPGLDPLITPFDRNPPATGVYLHTTLVNNLLQQNSLKVMDSRWYPLLLILGGPCLALFLSRHRQQQQLVGGIGLGIIWVTGSVAIFHLNYWVPTVWPFFLIILTASGLVVEGQLHERKQTQKKLTTLCPIYEALLPGNSFPTDQTSSVQVAAYLTDIATQISHQIWMDELTQIGNRRYFDRCLEQEWQRSIREHSTLAILMCDVDFFKGFNDTYGHLKGDSCLQQVANAIKTTAVRSGDLVARYGGEEFAVILPGTDANGAVHVAERICAVVKALGISHRASTISAHVTISVGVAVQVARLGIEAQSLVETADKALYEAKRRGRAQAVVYPTNAHQENLGEGV